MSQSHTESVSRFNCGSGGAQYCHGCYQMEPDNQHGEYVRWEDYEKLRAALHGAIVAWDTLYAKTTNNQFPFAEDLEFGPMLRARTAYDPQWYENRAFVKTLTDEDQSHV